MYLTGGATAVLHGWRASTVDIDLKLDPEPSGVFEAIGRLKDELDVNVELASPDHFIPVPDDWAARSDFVDRYGAVDLFHFDYRAQALSKIARGHDRDLADVRAMLARELVRPDELREAFEATAPRLARYPGLDAAAYRARVERFLEEAANERA